jgi:F-type H+-transporting ATPase subunit b
VRAAFLDGLVATIRALPDEKRGDAASGENLEIVSASPLPPDERATAQRRVAEAFGAGVEVGFAVDPALVAGLELRGAHLIVANNWRADLDRLKTEIADVG